MSIPIPEVLRVIRETEFRKNDGAVGGFRRGKRSHRSVCEAKTGLLGGFNVRLDLQAQTQRRMVFLERNSHVVLLANGIADVTG